MAAAEIQTNRIVVVGGPQTLEIVSPLAVEYGLQSVAHDTISAAMGDIGLKGDGVVAAIIDTVVYVPVKGDDRIGTLIDGLWRSQSEPIPTALIATEDPARHFSSKYGFREPPETWAIIPWPPEADVVRSWLTNAIRTRRTR